MQIGQKILDLLRRKLLTKRGHHVAAVANDVSDLRVVCGQSTLRKELPAEHAFEGAALLAS